ncbi:protein HUA2-LIKE 3-like isoform X1 [Mangifera indica]|uniref:protein HUA2-LIKE 3-like isoform X1 n=1 Tax=Mangifera indica TaxID=29780 RepID=UPI001CFABD34|nr:protein HUA2-LIKE 3-like isoform X1 [Mangifera indica]
MAPSRRKGASKAAAAARRQWKVGDLVLAKVKGFPAWPATVSEPEKWGYSADWKNVLVYFFGTQQIWLLMTAMGKILLTSMGGRHLKGILFTLPRVLKELSKWVLQRISFA